MSTKYELLPSTPDGYTPRSSTSDLTSNFPPPYSAGAGFRGDAYAEAEAEVDDAAWAYDRSGSSSPYTADFDIDVEEGAALLYRPIPGRQPRRRASPIPAFDSDPRFRVQTPSPYARAGLVLFTMFLFWLAFGLRRTLWIAGGAGGYKGNGKEVEYDYYQ